MIFLKIIGFPCIGLTSARISPPSRLRTLLTVAPLAVSALNLTSVPVVWNQDRFRVVCPCSREVRNTIRPSTRGSVKNTPTCPERVDSHCSHFRKGQCKCRWSLLRRKTLRINKKYVQKSRGRGRGLQTCLNCFYTFLSVAPGYSFCRTPGLYPRSPGQRIWGRCNKGWSLAVSGRRLQ